MNKVIMLAPHFYPAFKAGGPVVTCTSLAFSLSANFSVSVITSKFDLDGTPVCFKDSDELFPRPIYYNGCGRYLTPFYFFVEVVKARGRASVSINSFYDPFLSFFPLLISLFFPRVRLVVSIRGQLFEPAMSNRRRAKGFYFSVFKFLLRVKKKGVVLHLTSVAEEMRVRKMFGEKFDYSMIPNLPDFRLLNEFEKPQKSWSVKKKVLSVGRVSPIKNYEMLIRAAVYVRDLADFVIVGPIEDERYYKKLLRMLDELEISNVIFVGSKDKKELMSYYRNSDIYFHPALSENFCHSAVEAMLSGLPVVISSGIPWAAVADVGGRVVDPNNPIEASAALTDFLEKEPDELLKIGEACRSCILKELDLDGSRKMYDRLFSN